MAFIRPGGEVPLALSATTGASPLPLQASGASKVCGLVVTLEATQNVPFSVPRSTAVLVEAAFATGRPAGSTVVGLAFRALGRGSFFAVGLGRTMRYEVSGT